MSQRPSRPPPLPEKQSHAGAPHDGYDGSDMGYTSPELSPSFLTANIISSVEPSSEEDEAQTAAMPTHERAELSAPSVLPASSMQATVFGVQRISPAPASPPRQAPAAPVAQHLAPAVRTAPPQPPARPTAPASPASGLSAAAAALADQPTGFLRLPDAIGGGHTPASSRGGPASGAGTPSWLAEQPTSWVALQPSAAEAPMSPPASAGPAATPSRSRPSSAALTPSAAPSNLRPWLLSLGIGLLGGLVALALILSAMRYLSGNKPGSAAGEKSRSSESSMASRGREASEPALAPGALPALALDEAMRAVQRGDLERAITVLTQARERQTGSPAALDSLIDSLRRVRKNRLP